MFELAPHPVTTFHSVSRGAPLAGMPNADWVFCVGTEEKRAHNCGHRSYLQFCLKQIKLTRTPCKRKELWGGTETFPNFIRRTS